MRLARALPFLLMLSASLVPARAKVPLADGEILSYRVAWGIFLHAGEIDVFAKSETDDHKPFLAVTTLTSTRGVLRNLFKFEAQAESVFDRDGRMIVHTESSAGGKKRTNISLEFNYKKSTALFTDFIHTENSETIDLPPGDPLDLITSLVQTRAWDLKVGDARDILVLFEKEIYLLTVHALRYETIETPLGTFKTLVLEPRMEKTPPKGMFRKGSKVHVWIATEDPRKLPVRFEVEFAFGAGVAPLVKYQPPTNVAEAKTSVATKPSS